MRATLGPAPQAPPAMRAATRLILAAALALGASARAGGARGELQAALAGVTEAKLRAVVAKLSEGGSRLSGYPRGHELADWIAERFRGLGLRDVEQMAFPVTVPLQKHAWLQVDGEARIPLHAAWPNLVRTSTLPRTRGRLLYAADGHLYRLNGLDLRGSVVLLDFNSRGRWESAAMLGAAACVFIGTEELAANELRNKYYDTPLDMPRFWIDQAAGERLRDRLVAEAGKPADQRQPLEVTISAQVRWEELLAENIYGFVDGTHPELSRELVVVEAYYDSVSVVPSLAPGAGQACSLASLLALAEHFAAHPPKRSMLFLASSGHAQAMAGVRHFFDAFDKSVVDLNTAVAEAAKEVARLERLREALAPIDELEAELRAVRAAVAAALPAADSLAGMGQAWTAAERAVRRLERLEATGAPPEQLAVARETARAAVAAMLPADGAAAVLELCLAAVFDDTMFAPAFPAPELPRGHCPRALVERLATVAGAYDRLEKVLVARRDSEDPSDVFGGGQVEASRRPLLAEVAVGWMLVLGVCFLLTRGHERGEEKEEGEARPQGGSFRWLLVALAAGLGVAAAWAGPHSDVLLAACSSGGGLLLLTALLLGHDGVLAAIRPVLRVAGVVALWFAVLAAEAGVWGGVVLIAPAMVLLALSLGLRLGAAWWRACDIVLFLSLSVVACLLSTRWSEAGLPLPAAALLFVVFALAELLVVRRVTAGVGRQTVVAGALTFALLFLMGLTPVRVEAEADVLRAKLVERLRDPMRLRAEACAKDVYRLRSSDSEDAERIEELDALRLRYKRLSWRDGYKGLDEAEAELFHPMVERARRELATRLAYRRRRLEVLRDKLRLASLLVHYEAEKQVTERDKAIYLYAGLELSSKTAQVGACREGWLYRLPGIRQVVDTYSPLSERLSGFARDLEGAWDFARAEPRSEAGYAALHEHERLYHDVIRGKRGRPWHTYIPRLGLSSEVASLAGVPGVTFATLNDERHRVDSPADTIEHVNFANLATQTRLLLAMLGRAADDPTLIGYVKFHSGFGRVTGRLNMELSGRRLPDQPVPGALAMFYRGWWYYLVGARRRCPQITGPDGEFEYVGIANRPRARWRWMRVDGYQFDDAGNIVMAINNAMLKKYPNGFRNNDPNRSIRPVLFDCKSVALYNLFDQRYFQQLWGIRVLDARRESNPIRFGYEKWWINGVLYVEPLTPLKFIMAQRLRGVRLVLLNASAEEPEGVGYTVEQLRREPLVPLLVARDFVHLVEYRLGVLEEKGIRNQRLRELHRQAKGFLAEAEKQLAARQYDQAIDAARSAWAYESRAYPDVQATIHDTVAGVLFYVALLLPFAHCIERLFLSLSRVTPRATATVGIMALAIAVLWQVHPAFELSNNPLIVILAFFLLALGGLTMTIIVARFEDEMKKLERARSGIEVADVSRVSAFGAAFALGISNMRRRKIRTALTAATLIILTFAIMSFTSTRTRPVEREQAIEAAPSYKGVLIRRKLWARMSGLVYSTLYDKYRRDAIVAPRIWRGPQRKGERSYIDLRSLDGRRKFTVKSLLGLSTQERKLLSGQLLTIGRRPGTRLLEAGRWFADDNALEILLPRRVAQALGIGDADVAPGPGGGPPKAKVQLFGIEFTVVGIFDGAGFEGFLDLNGEPVTPVDWSVEQEAAEQEKEAAAQEESETGEDTREMQYIHVPAGEMAVLPYMTLWTLGGGLRSVAVAFDPEKGVPKDFAGRPKKQSIAAMRQHLKDRLTLTLYFGDEQGVYKFTAADVPSFQGLRNVFVPLVIAFLIVLNTMLGSVHERIREVGIYSSVGLAPGHISMLFIAEALGLATVSAVAGYLVSQTVVKVLFAMGWMDTQHMFLNYSSMATVGSLLLVVLMVLASTAYPARMVSRVASPDIERRWQLPPVSGSRIELRLPYSLSRHDVPGLMLFLYNYIRAHEETSLGVFCVRDVGLSTEDGRILLRFSAWLAPYDLGVYQQVSVTSAPAEDPGFDNATVAIDRVSGEPGAWKRNNQTFLNQVRKQFLIWRAIGAAGREKYIKQGAERFGHLASPQDADRESD